MILSHVKYALETELCSRWKVVVVAARVREWKVAVTILRCYPALEPTISGKRLPLSLIRVSRDIMDVVSDVAAVVALLEATTRTVGFIQDLKDAKDDRARIVRGSCGNFKAVRAFCR